MYMGVTTTSPDYEFLIAGDIVTLSGDDVMPSCDEIKKARGE
jgi:hypothetical protein